MEWMKGLAGFSIIPILWFSLFFLFSYASGWKRLARKYHTDTILKLPNQYLVKAHVGYSALRGMRYYLWAKVTEQGLYLRPGPGIFFRFNHPALLIPWHDLDIREYHGRFYRWYLWVSSRLIKFRVLTTGTEIYIPCTTLEGIAEFIKTDERP